MLVIWTMLSFSPRTTTLYSQRTCGKTLKALHLRQNKQFCVRCLLTIRAADNIDVREGMGLGGTFGQNSRKSGREVGRSAQMKPMGGGGEDITRLREDMNFYIIIFIN